MAEINTLQKSNSKFARLMVAGVLGTLAFNAIMYVKMLQKLISSVAKYF